MFIVLDNLSIVSSTKWHQDKKYRHQKVFVGTYNECQQFVSLECEKILAV